ncbi:phospholipase D family protein [Sedimentimonas flavescens]|uniref:Phospholipase D n=1 Tax=Sedimentimonas flavescens TaxID=2851012 RepID=A0ABT3A003_9RHOB|nr:phospholipase D family protein [Sedimentimonas flavescens]MCV2879054.1 phospholipase D family protein [Sedimentimonas flavescens]
MTVSYARTGWRLIMAGLIAGWVSACSLGPGTYTKNISVARMDTDTTWLARRIEAMGNPHDGRSGVYLLRDGAEALALRLVLSERAEKTIDAQYYLLHDDVAGHLFLWKLLEAADRGVRVRLLLDDIDMAVYDPVTAALDAHPNIEIRLFNPFWRSAHQAVVAAMDFPRINRRMHNKSMTFDNTVTILGGRNIGAEYFAARDDSNYDDLDILAAGPAAQEVSSSFDTYWNSPYAVPSEVVIKDHRDAAAVSTNRAHLQDLAREAQASPYGEALHHGIRDALGNNSLKLHWVPAQVFADAPDKAKGGADSATFLSAALEPYITSAQSELYVVSAYFVPRRRGVDLLAAMEARGVDVTVLTNSMDSTDVLAVYGHYALSRRALIEAGVDLWELRSNTAREDRKRLGLEKSLSGLHSKAFAVDGRHLFIGSFNWDPRSVHINTEMGLMIDSPELTQEVLRIFKRDLPDRAYQVTADENGKLNWLSRREDGVTLLHLWEPYDSVWRAFMSGVYGFLPIGKQL